MAEKFKSKALEANLAETRYKEIKIIPEYQSFINLSKKYFGINKRAYDCIVEFQHPFSNRKFVSEELRKILLSDYWYYIALDDPQNAFNYLNRGSAYGLQGEYERAIQDFDRVIELDPQNASVYIRRGLASNDLGEYELSIQDYNKAIELAPQNADAYLLRGRAYYFLGENEHAIQDFDKTIELNPKDSEAYLNRVSADDCQPAA